MLRVSGLQGGHSGQQIDDNLINAIKALGYVLALTADELGRGRRDPPPDRRPLWRPRGQRHPT